MKAIETQYKGYRFRSRTEARWAVFFEALGVDWLYEPEGFVLEDGTHYLPDFLIENKFYVEVKGSEPTDREREKCRMMAQEHTIVLLSGIPSKTYLHRRDYGMHYFIKPGVALPKECGIQEGTDMAWALCGHGCKHLMLSWCDLYELDGKTAAGWFGMQMGANGCPDITRAEGDIEAANYAAVIARSARFEHGETPAV